MRFIELKETKKRNCFINIDYIVKLTPYADKTLIHTREAQANTYVLESIEDVLRKIKALDVE